MSLRVSVVAGCAWLVCAMVFFRGAIFSGFAEIAGDPGDARFVMAICEHWYMVLQGLADWRDPMFFHPVKGVLGYSDAMILFVPPYVLARVLGADVYLAFQVMLILLNAFGFATFLLFSKRYLRVDWRAALLGALLFAFANNLYLVAGHPQLYAAYLVPGWLWLTVSAWKASTDRPRWALAKSVGSGVYFALLLYTAYYIGWFVALGLAVYVTIWLLPCGGIVRITAEDLRRGGRVILGAGLGFALGCVPFLLTYLPVIAQGFGRDPAVILTFLGSPRDLLNVGVGNLLWGGMLGGFGSHDGSTVSNTELSLAVTPLVSLMAVTGGLVLSLAGSLAGRRYADARMRSLLVAGTLTCITLMVLPIRWGALIPWNWVLELPGAMAIRAVYRLQIVVGLVSSLLVVVVFDRMMDATRRRAGRFTAQTALVLLGLILLIEQWNGIDVARVDRLAGEKMLQMKREVPEGCDSFVLGDVREVDTQHPIARTAAQQIDAMLLSQAMGLPTVNGYSGQFPVGWRMLDPRDPAFIENVNSWSDRHGGMGGLCIYGQQDGIWLAPKRIEKSEG